MAKEKARLILDPDFELPEGAERRVEIAIADHDNLIVSEEPSAELDRQVAEVIAADYPFAMVIDAESTKGGGKGS